MAKKKVKKTEEELKAEIAEQVPDVLPCAVCGGSGKDPNSGDPLKTCGICNGTGEQSPEWDEACKRAGVPMDSGAFCHNDDIDCSSFVPATNGNKHSCANVKHDTSLNLDERGWAMKCESCLADISARVLKIRAKAKEGFSDAPVDENPADNDGVAQSDDNALNTEHSEVGENVVTEKTHVNLIVTASSDRMLELGKRLADYEVEKANIEARKKARVAEFNGEIAEIEALGETLEQEPVRDDTDLTNAVQCEECGHIQGKGVAKKCVKCGSENLNEYAPEPVKSGVDG